MPKVEIVSIPIDKLVEHPENPNFMVDGQFNKLSENIKEVGMVENLQVAKNKDGTFTIIGGHHRFRAAKINGYTELPCVIIDDLEEGKPNWENKRRFQLLRMNIIKGKIDPLKFTEMFNNLSDKYDREALREMFGFWDEKSFEMLYKEVKSGLPIELQEELEKSKKSIKTIDDLALILNRLFNEYGNTLESGFMIIDYGGKDSIWVQADSKLWGIVKPFADSVHHAKLNITNELYEILKNSQRVKELLKEGDF